MKYLPPDQPKVFPKLKMDKVDIPIMLISISMSKMIFIKFLPPVRPKLLPKLSAEILLKYVSFHISITTLIYLRR